MLYREIIAVCSQIHTKHINTLCGQNAELLNVKPGVTYSNHRAVKCWPVFKTSPNNVCCCGVATLRKATTQCGCTNMCTATADLPPAVQ